MTAPEKKSPEEGKGRNLILIGFMGTGKTTVGKRVARDLGFRFVDTDELIVETAGKSIPDIFSSDGEDAFRNLETGVLQQCIGEKNQVLSTGGGIVLRKENRELLKRAGYVIWLQASAAAIVERVKRNRDRPLLATENPAQTVKKMLRERQRLYEEAADLAIATDNLMIEETVYGVAESARIALGNG